MLVSPRRCLFEQEYCHVLQNSGCRCIDNPDVEANRGRKIKRHIHEERHSQDTVPQSRGGVFFSRIGQRTAPEETRGIHLNGGWHAGQRKPHDLRSWTGPQFSEHRASTSIIAGRASLNHRPCAPPSGGAVGADACCFSRNSCSRCSSLRCVASSSLKDRPTCAGKNYPKTSYSKDAA